MAAKGAAVLRPAHYLPFFEPLKYGEWVIELMSPYSCRVRHESLKHIEVVLTYNTRVSLLRSEITVRGLIERIRIMEDILAGGYYHACLGGTLYEIVKMPYGDEIDERWLVNARGDVNFQVECSTNEALSLALLLNDIYAPDVHLPLREIYKFSVERGLLPLFKRVREAALRYKGARCFLVREKNDYYLIPERSGRCEELALLLDFATSLGVNLRVPINERDVINLLLSVETLPSILSASNLMIELRKFIIYSMISKMRSGVKTYYRGRRLVIRNSYGVWKIDLRSGSLELNRRPLCIHDPSETPGVIKLPQLGLMRLDKTTSRVIGVTLVALRPHAVKDPILRRQIRAEARRPHGFF